MTVSITKNLTDLYNAESISGWTTDDAVTTYTGFQREGTYCLGMQGSEGTVYAYKTITSVNLSNTVIYSWMNAGSVDTKANGGFRIVVGDGTNTIAYYVGGSDDYGFQIGAWSCFVLDTANPPSNYATLAGSEASLNFSAITQIGVQFNVPIKAVGSGDNVFFDICRYGTGITVQGGGVGTEGTFAEIAADDASTASGKAYGIIRELQSGVYGVQGKLTFGDNSGTSSTYFKDTNAIIIFEDRAVPSTHYAINVVGNSTGTNSFILGSKSGSAGIAGCVIKSAGSVKVSIDGSDANVDEFKLYGSTFLDVGTVTLPANATNKEVLNCIFDSSSEVLADTCVVQNCTFISSDGRAIRMSSTSHNITDCDFINCPHGVHINNTGTYTFDNMVFTGENGTSIYAIENSTAGSVTVNATNGSNPQYADNTGGGSTTINNSVWLKVYVEDEDGNNIQNAQTAIYKSSDMTELMNKDTDVNGLASTTYNYTGDVDITVRIRKSSSGGTRYFPYTTSGTITSDGYTLYAVLIRDNIAG